MEYRLFRSPERREVNVIKTYAEEAKELRRKGLATTLQIAVSKVLSQHRVHESERQNLMRQVMAELGRQGAKRRAENNAAQEENRLPPVPPHDPPSLKTLMADAYARQNNEHLVPRDAWDSDAEEKTRKPLSDRLSDAA